MGDFPAKQAKNRVQGGDFLKNQAEYRPNVCIA